MKRLQYLIDCFHSIAYLKNILNFRCLHGTGGMLQFRLDRSARVIVACGVLHNIDVENNVDLVLGEGKEDIDLLPVHAEAEDDGPRGYKLV